MNSFINEHDTQNDFTRKMISVDFVRLMPAGKQIKRLEIYYIVLQFLILLLLLF